MIDQALIFQVKKRSEGSFQRMYEGCIRYVYAIVRRYVSNESDHQDVIQEIFARVFLRIDSFDERKGEFKFWLRRLSINQCIQHYHKQNGAIRIVSLDAVEKAESEVNETLSDLSKEEILLYLKRMPEGYKQVFMMVIIDEYSHQDVSEILNISPETSRTQLHRAKKWLRENLSGNNLKVLVGGI